MASISGLSSGLDTDSIIRQLMQLERIPQARLQSKQQATESMIGSFRTLNTKFLSIVSAAEKLGATLPGAPVPNPPKPDDWQLSSATSSDTTRVSAQAVTGAPASSLSFNVAQLAAADSQLSGIYDAKTAPFSTTGGLLPLTHTSLTLTKGVGTGAVSTTISTGDGSLAATVDAINKAQAGVTASLLETEPGKFRLQLTSTTTGAASSLSLKNPDGIEMVPTEVVAGRDAKLDVGGGVTITRPTNTLSDVVQGVTLTLAKADAKDASGAYVDPKVTITVAKDVEGIAAKVQALVDAANAARNDARSLSAADPVTKAKGRLYGESLVRGLADQVRTAVPDSTAGPIKAGVTVGKDGTISFDKATFLKALAADPAAVEAALGADGMAGRLHALGDQVSRSASSAKGPGSITSAIASKEGQITLLKSNIESWDSRLAMKEKQLQRQYTALETALGKAQSQGQWLAGQLANLPTWS